MHHAPRIPTCDGWQTNCALPSGIVEKRKIGNLLAMRCVASWCSEPECKGSWVFVAESNYIAILGCDGTLQLNTNASREVAMPHINGLLAILGQFPTDTPPYGGAIHFTYEHRDYLLRTGAGVQVFFSDGVKVLRCGEVL
jgi:hypothetical protein